MPHGPARRPTAVRDENLQWASPKQEQCYRYGPVGLGAPHGGPIIASGGFGSAKTYAFCLKILWLCDTFPNYRALIFRRVWAELQRTTMSTFFKLCPPWLYDRRKGGRRADSEKYLRLINGSEIFWMHMDDPDTEGIIRGIELNAFFGDQMEEINEEIFDLLMGRLGRWDKAQVPDWMVAQAGGRYPFHDANGKPIAPTYALGACNPDTELHWIYRRFHPDSPEHSMTRKTHDGRDTSYRREGYLMVQMASYENKFLPKVNLDILMSKDESFRRRYVEGEWGIPEGQIHFIDPKSYLEWSPELIDWIVNSCNLYRVLDHGDAAPTCCLWMAVTGAGEIIWYREYYMPNRLISYHRHRITELSGHEQYRGNYADPSILKKTMQKHGGRWSVADEYLDTRRLGRTNAIAWQAADNNELGTRNRINEFLAVRHAKTIHPIYKDEGHWPSMFFVKRSDAYPYGCDQAIRQTTSQRREKLGTEDGKPIFGDDRDESIADHAYDCVRYGTATRPSVPRDKLPEYSEKTFHGKRMMMKRAKRRAKMKARRGL